LILVDANLLIYGVVEDLPQHAAAREWLEGRLNDSPRVGLPWPSLLAFVRLVGNARLFRRPVPIEKAWEQVEEWLSLPSTWVPGATEKHATVLARTLADVRGRANLVPDAHLAALAIEHGLVLCSADRDFARFRGLRWENPLN
jgi:toxin-antitoxin system PIN domain toxin